MTPAFYDVCHTGWLAGYYANLCPLRLASAEALAAGERRKGFEVEIIATNDLNWIERALIEEAGRCSPR